MSRTPSLAPEYVKEIDDFIANHPILESDKYSPTSQECTGPIEMVGSCESVNIQGLSNINWLDVSYKQINRHIF